MSDYPVPAGLSPRSQVLWSSVVPSTGRSPGRLALVEQALRALDRADEAAAIVTAEGMVVGGTGKMAHCHPLLRIEKESRSLFSKLWGLLNLHWDNPTFHRDREML